MPYHKPARRLSEVDIRIAKQSNGCRITGFRLRAAIVCPGDAKAMVRRAFAPVSSPEFQAFSKAFPQTIEKWMGEGAGAFNNGVMQSGIVQACAKAR